jgi:hypothetical protein
MRKPRGPDTPEALAAGRERHAAVRRGDRLLVHIARVELALSDLPAIDQLICLNACLENVLHDDARREAGRAP